MPAELILRQPLRVLFIEDSHADVDLISAVLIAAGYDLTSRVAHTQEELRACSGQSFDLVLSDFRLPGWTGMDALQVLRDAETGGPRAPFILVTGALGEEMAVECLKEGVSDFVVKDHLDRLPRVVTRALMEQRMRSERELAIDQLRRAHEQLESRVAERTAELSAINLALVTEMEQRRFAESALRESERQFRLLAEALPEMVWTAGPNGAVDYANQRWFEYTGLWLEPTESWGREQVLHPEDLAPTIARWNESLQSGLPYQEEFRLRRALDGEYRWHFGTRRTVARCQRRSHQVVWRLHRHS